MPDSDGYSGDVGTYCHHCENWHTGSCQNIPKDEPVVGIDTEFPLYSANQSAGQSIENAFTKRGEELQNA